MSNNHYHPHRDHHHLLLLLFIFIFIYIIVVAVTTRILRIIAMIAVTMITILLVTLLLITILRIIIMMIILTIVIITIAIIILTTIIIVIIITAVAKPRPRTSFDQIQQIRRPVEVGDTGLLADLLWSDPSSAVETWGKNDRGVSFTFGPEVVKAFLKKHNLDLIARAHQVVEDGYEFFAGRQVVTVFSAPNYCGEFDNAGALMSIDDELRISFCVLKPEFRPF